MIVLNSLRDMSSFCSIEFMAVTFFEHENEPNPISWTFSPFDTTVIIVSKTLVKTVSISLFVILVSLKILVISSFLFMKIDTI